MKVRCALCELGNLFFMVIFILKMINIPVCRGRVISFILCSPGSIFRDFSQSFKEMLGYYFEKFLSFFIRLHHTRIWSSKSR